MATLYVARLDGDAGFSRTVAVKELRRVFAKDPSFIAMLAEEARLGAHVRHSNVVTTLDVVVREDETLLVLDYVHGEALGQLLSAAKKRGEVVPIPIAVALVAGALRGLHAIHEARDATGKPLEIIHRDLSPQNILVGVDGIARVADFGIAKARGRGAKTETGVIKGKTSYLAPEQVHGESTQRSDLFSMAAVAWEVLAGEQLFGGASPNEVLAKVLAGKIRSLESVRSDVPADVVAVVRDGLAREPARRPTSALEMAERLEAAVTPASVVDVGAWVGSLAGPSLEARAALLAVDAPAISPPIASTPLLTETLRLQAPPRGPSGRRRSATIAGVAGALTVAVVLTLAVVRAPSARRAPESTPAASVSSTSLDVLPPGAAPLSGEAEATAATPQATSSAVDPPAAAPPYRPAARRAADHCAVPYFVDSSGHIKYKRECLVR
jgi:serine/threonine-protein kinase